MVGVRFPSRDAVRLYGMEALFATEKNMPLPRVDWPALVISIAAVGFSAAQWYEQSEQRYLQYDVALSFELNTAGIHRYGIGVKNAGPGVAFIQDVTYYIDGKPIKFDDLVDALEDNGIDTDKLNEKELLRGDTLTSGETAWIFDYRARGPAAEERATNLFENRVQVAVSYRARNGRVGRICSTAPDPGCPFSAAP